MKIKICGMRDAANIQALATLQPDYVGLIFYAASKRFVKQIDPGILESLSASKVTGVFVNESPEVVLSKSKHYHLKAVQLHGHETPEYCRSLYEVLKSENSGVELIKAFGVDETFDFGILEEYDNAVDFFLFDTKTPAHGGSGIKFNWQTLENYDLDKPYFLSGGIGLDDLNSLKLLGDPRLYAVDMNSKFEISPGLKDIEHVRRAINIIRSSGREG